MPSWVTWGTGFDKTYQGEFPDTYRRYIDDGLETTELFRNELEKFINFSINFHTAIKFISQIATTSLNFLDINFNDKAPVLVTTIHYKHTDSHSYLFYTFSHPSFCKDVIPYSQFLKLRRLYSSNSDFKPLSFWMSSEPAFIQNLFPKIIGQRYLPPSLVPHMMQPNRSSHTPSFFHHQSLFLALVVHFKRHCSSIS